MSNGSKKCSKCGETKSLASGFHRSSESKDGYKSACKACRNDAERKWREQNPDKDREAKRKWREQNPDKDRESKRKWREQNPEKLREAQQRYSRLNAEKVRAAQRRWEARNPTKIQQRTQRRRARLRDADIYVVHINDQRRLSRSECVACGAPADSIDHAIPLCRGGSHGVGNLVAMCQRCNSSKNSKTISEWRKANDWLPLGRFPQRKDQADGAA